MLDIIDEGISFPLKLKYDRVNYTIEGVRQNIPPSALDIPSSDDAGDNSVRVALAGNRRVQVGRRWMRIRALPRTIAYIPQLEDGGPDVSTLNGMRLTFESFGRGHIDTITDDWITMIPDADPRPWIGTTTFLTADLPVDQDVPSDKVEAQIADMASSRPWDRGEPPMSIYVDAAPFVRRADGIWCRRDTASRLYPVNGNGERSAKLETFGKSEVSYHDQERPGDISLRVWWKMMTNPIDDSGGRTTLKVHLLSPKSGPKSGTSNVVRFGRIIDGGKRCQVDVTDVAQLFSIFGFLDGVGLL